MKRLHVINLEKMGGAEKVFLNLIKNHLDNDDIILCISNSIADEILQELQGSRVLFVNRMFNSIPLKYPSFIRKSILQLKIEQQRADAVLFWDFIPHLARKTIDGKYFYYDHGSSWRHPENKKTAEFFQKIDACISVSYASKRILQERFRLSIPIRVIRNTLPFPLDSVIQDKHSPTRKQLTLGTASRLVSLKCIGISILTIAKLRKLGYNARLLIAGKGPNEASLHQLIERLDITQHVIFLGFQQDLTEFYRSIDFYMSLSVSESFGLSSMDALYHGVPCIYSMIDGQAEVISNGLTGVGITPTLSPDEYRKQVGYSVETPYFSYDPLSDRLVNPKIVDSEDCVSAIDTIIKNKTYPVFIENIKEYMRSSINDENVSDKLNAFITEMSE